MRIRTAAIEDLSALTGIEAQCFPAAEAATEADLYERLSAYPNHFWLLEKQGQIISFVNGMATDEPDLKDEMYHDASFHKSDGEWQMIFGVNTLPDFRRQGFAGTLIEHVIQVSKATGKSGLVLTCKANLIPYYAKFDFINEGAADSSHGGAAWYQMRLTFK